MGYWTRPEQVILNEPFLSTLLECVSEQRACNVELDPTQRNQLYNIREILASCSAYPDLFDGRFANLQKAVRCRIDYPHKRIVIEPRAISVLTKLPRVTTAIESTPVEDDLMQELRRAEAATKQSEPRPSFMDKLKKGTYRTED